MEFGSRLRWGAAIVGIVLLLVGSIIGLVLIARNIFDGGNDSAQTEQAINLEDYNRPGIRLGLEVQGPVTAKEKAVAYRLTVSRTERVAQLIRGYDGFIEKEQRIDNTEESFDVFIKALERAGFDRVDGSTEPGDEEGVCATGKRYILTIEDEGIQVFRAWKTSCGGDQGNSLAPQSVRNLFTKQFPELSKILSGSGLN